MCENVLNRVIHREIECAKLIQCLIQYGNENDFFEEYECTKEEFVGFFLNFIHEEFRSNNHNVSFDLNEANCSTPKKSKNNTIFQTPLSPLYKNDTSFTTPKSKSLTLGDFLVSKKLSNKKPPTRKRIKPVNFNEDKSDIFHKSENSFNFTNSDIMPLERENLAEERMKMFGEFRELKIPKTTARQCIDEVIPDVRHVSFQAELTFIIDIYTNLLNENFIVNLNSEIIFLISFLVKRRHDESGIQPLETKLTINNLFRNYHNQMFFTIKSLERQSRILCNYDSSTIKLLKTNEILEKFAPQLTNQLKSTPAQPQLQEAAPHQNFVHFNCDTDNRQNFPSEMSFSAFRKQRDLFYDICRQWEHYHDAKLSGKIKCLFEMSDESMNFAHLARLFRSHLLGRCEGEADKLSRLRNRCVTKGGGDEFDEGEEFYRSFIEVGGNWRFNRHLIDAFIEEVGELNGRSFDGDSETDLRTKKAFYLCVKQLRCLGKFLAFIETLPYKTDLMYNDNILGVQVNIRKQTTPIFDVRKILDNAICQNSVILTLPWLVTYMSMLDHVTLALPYYTQIMHTLDWLRCNFSSSRASNVYFCKSLIGWLFEHLPTFMPQRHKTKLRKNVGLDNSDIIDHQILYLCCPHLNEIKKLLSSNLATNIVSVKHITPVSAPHKPEEVARKKIECHLEEAFLIGQPISLRKTIEFVSERVASSCVKYLCHTFVPKQKKNAILDFEKIIEHHSDLDQVALKLKANDYAVTCLDQLKKQCQLEIEKISSEKITNAMSALVALDMLAQTQSVAMTIARKQCIERIAQWIDSQVTLSVFTKDFYDVIARGHVMRKPTFVLPPGGRNIKHNDKATSGAHLLDKIQMLIVSVLENEPITERIVPMLDEVYTTITERCDVSEALIANVCCQILDLTVLLLSKETRSIVFDGVYLTKCKRIWRLYYSDCDNLFKNLLCPRNVKFMTVALNRRKSWEALARFCALLICMDLMQWNCFESQCMGIYRFEWDEMTLVDITEFFKCFTRFYRDQGGDTFLLDFLSEYCDDLF